MTTPGTPGGNDNYINSDKFKEELLKLCKTFKNIDNEIIEDSKIILLYLCLFI